jgi:translocator protein
VNTPRSFIALVAWIAVAFLGAIPGTLWSPGEWYAQLNKPAWNPPNAIFPIAWTALYAAMGIAAWCVWRRAGWHNASRALTMFFVQLALNAAWTPVFFGAHQIGWALVVIIALWLAILGTLCAFAQLHRTAAWLLAPYLAWVSFATALNFALWRLN